MMFLPTSAGKGPAMIGFESEEIQLKKLREQLRAMSDAELIRFGKALRRLAGQRVSGVPHRINRLEEARQEWRRPAPSFRVCR